MLGVVYVCVSKYILGNHKCMHPLHICRFEIYILELLRSLSEVFDVLLPHVESGKAKKQKQSGIHLVESNLALGDYRFTLPLS